MVSHKTRKKAVPSKKKVPGGGVRTKAARARAASTTVRRKVKQNVVAHPEGLKPAARIKATPPKTKSAKTAPAKAVRAKGTPAQGAPVKATPRPSPAAAHRPAPPIRVAATPRDDAARRRIQVLEQERAELQDLGNQMRAELDSAMAESERLREHLREQMRDLESPQRRPTAAEPGPASPGGFDAAADLDEEIPAVPDDDLEETAGFFDRMDEIRARRNELDRERNDRELEQSDQPFWMICPKCGDLMEESEGENVKLERCENCGGLYLDRGEVDLILSLCAGPDAYRRLHNIMKF